MDELIRKSDAIAALGEEPLVWCDGEDELAEREQWRRDVAAINAVDAVDMRCDNCKWQKDQSGIRDGDAWKWVPCRVLITPEYFYCKEWERRTDEGFDKASGCD